MSEKTANIVPSTPVPEASTEVKKDAPSFADFEKKSKQIGDDTILSIMDDTLEVLPGEKAFMIKSWLDQIPADTSDAEFTHDPEKVITFRNQLSDFVINRLSLGSRAGEVDEDGRKYLRQRKQAFLNKTTEDKKKVADFVHNIDNPSQRPNYSAAEFYGMTVKTQDGKTHDLLAGENAGVVRSNIKVQREVAGMFVHYSSRSYERARLHGEKPELTRRIYLNPKIEDSVEIFDEIVSAAEDAGIVMKGKIFDRLAEGVDKKARHNSAGEFTLRGDGIVLAAGEDADTLLSLVEAVYKDRYDSFKGRKTSKIPLKIADGIAIGDEQEADSLTSHRAKLLEKVKAETERLLVSGNGAQANVVSIFRNVYEEMAVAENVNPNNIAFNLHSVAA